MQRAISVKVECALSICPLDEDLQRIEISHFLEQKIWNWHEEKLGSLSIIKDMASGNCCKIFETLFFIFSLLGISFTTKYFE